MADPTLPVPYDTRRSNFNATELRELTGWPDLLVEDYLAGVDAQAVLVTTVTKIVHVGVDLPRAVRRVTAGVDNISADDQEVFFGTDGGAITANLPTGVSGRNYRLINAGSSGNRVTIVPAGSDLLFGENASEYLDDGDVVLITYEPTEGWL